MNIEFFDGGKGGSRKMRLFGKLFKMKNKKLIEVNEESAFPLGSRAFERINISEFNIGIGTFSRFSR